MTVPAPLQLQPSARSPSPLALPRIEWPTLGVAALIYGGWLAATFWHAKLPWPVELAAGGWLTAWQSSLQHEAIHGHPTPWRRVNTAIAVWPLTLWLPYGLYRDSHLAHHAAEALTRPGSDPESHYAAPPRSPLARLDHRLSVATSTLLGRLVLGPPVMAARFLLKEGWALARSRRNARAWLVHALLVSVVLGWLLCVCRMSLWEYVAFFLYPGSALSLVRSYAEHRAHPEPAKRVAVVERAPVLGLLFLHNNLHALHHRRPGLAWYRLPRAYREGRSALLAENGGLVYRGYREVFARFLFRPQDRVIHPDLAARAQA